MHVKVFERSDGATVVVPLALRDTVPPADHGLLREIGDAELDLTCLSTALITALGVGGYCVAVGDDVEEVLRCLSQWRSAFVAAPAT